MPVDKLPKLARYAGKGFAASLVRLVSDCTSNPIRVLKVYMQTSLITISYPDATRAIIKTEGLQGLFLRGLGTRLFTNGLQSMVFAVAWNGGSTSRELSKGNGLARKMHYLYSSSVFY